MADFDGRLFQTLLRTAELGRWFVYREVTETTMTLARREADEGAPNGTIVLAEQQTAGRGRRGRSFFSPAGENLYFTLVLRPTQDEQTRLQIALPLAVAEACAETGVDAMIKWPNDVWVDGLKVCGMLIDAETSHGKVVVFPGIGINVNGDPTVNTELAGIATSLRLASGSVVQREAVLASVCNGLEVGLSTPMGELLAAYRERSLVLGRDVLVSGPEGEFEGRASTVGEGGELVIEKADGTRVSVLASDVSLRPLV